MGLRITQRSDEGIVLSGERLSALGLREGDVLEIEGASGVVSLVRGDVPFISGDLRSMWVADLLMLLNRKKKTGVAKFALEGGRRAVFFRKGEVVFAASSFFHDRIGQVLYRTGRVTTEQLEAAENALQPGGMRFGDIILDEGFVTSAELYRGLVQQIRDIVHGLFAATDGRFIFVEEDVSDQQDFHLLEGTSELILNGIRRLDDIERCKEVVKLGAVYLADPSGAGMTPQEITVLHLVNGIRTAAEVVEESQLGELLGLKILAHLIRARRITERSTHAASAARLDVGGEAIVETYDDEAEIEWVEEAGEESTDDRSAEESSEPMEPAFTVYGRIVQGIHRMMVKEGKDPSALGGYFAAAPDAHQPIFDGVTVDENGRLDLPRVIANAKATQGDQYKGRVLEALEAYQSFALFQAHQVLPADCAAKLQRFVLLIQHGKA